MTEEKEPLMGTDELEEDLKRSKGDVVHTVTKGVLSLMPIAGGTAAEFFNEVIAPPISRRRDQWLIEIAKAINKLNERVEGFEIEDLSENETFITTIMHATQVAIRNHQAEKLVALKNAVINSALKTRVDDDLIAMFLDFIDSFTTLHLKILIIFDDPGRWAETHGHEFPHWGMAGLGDVLEHAYPELKGQGDFYEAVWTDLYNKGLLNTPGMDTTMSGHGLMDSRTTNLAEEFIEFIKSGD
jgi:hypothetical protein